MTLQLVSHPLPVAWDGRPVTWDRWQAAPVVMICGPAASSRCACGSSSQPWQARGLREPDPADVARAAALPRIGRPIPLVYPVYDLHAFRCQGCGEVQVWDMDADAWWTLDDADYGPTGSWSWSGGLLDALLTGEA